MNLSKYSKLKFFGELNHWHLDADTMQQLYNYLVHGFSPGSFHEALFSNDAAGALSRSHPGNNLLNLINLARFLRSTVLWGRAFGSYEVVGEWLRMSDEQRRAILIDAGMANSEARDIDLALRDDHDPGDSVMFLNNDSVRLFFDVSTIT